MSDNNACCYNMFDIVKDDCWTCFWNNKDYIRNKIADKDSGGNTILHLAIIYDRQYLFGEILDLYPGTLIRGIKRFDERINVRNSDGDTPLDLAYNYKREKMWSIIAFGGGKRSKS